ncbi:YaiI/YqxD family protein [Clostridium senegalense]|uniref:YaiI/YqxD family protein n=1 Tax=Clostridium senegalense TaxID=1465809 RepID=UPI0002886064|nr:YaiI/YqxD family protein [Clostridium senegalense]
MKILVDADACPAKQIIENVAKEYGKELIFYCDINHVLTVSYGDVKYMDSGFQSVDMKIVNEVSDMDIVVTQDYGVAAMVLGKRAFAISPKGHIYSNDNIDKLLFERHISGKVRRGGGKTSNPKKRKAEDDERLYKNLKKLVANS